MSHSCLVEEQLFNLGAGIQRKDLLSSLTAEGHRPPGHVQTGFTRGLPAPRSVRNTCMSSLVIMVVFLEDSTEIESTLEKAAFLENSL